MKDHINPSCPFWAGLLGGIGSALGLMLCNHDAYHYPWLTGLLQPLLIFSCVAVFLPLVPASLLTPLLSKRMNLSSIPLKVFVVAFCCVALFFGAGLAALFGLQHLRQTSLCNAHADGRIVSTAQTMGFWPHPRQTLAGNCGQKKATYSSRVRGLDLLQDRIILS